MSGIDSFNECKRMTAGGNAGAVETINAIENEISGYVAAQTRFAQKEQGQGQGPAY